MKLTELNPQWLGSGGDGVSDRDGNPVPVREGVMLTLDCPCGGCGRPLAVPINNPLDGGPPVHGRADGAWQRIGDTFETLTLTPSIQRMDPNGCRWHGFITNGEIVNA